MVIKFIIFLFLIFTHIEFIFTQNINMKNAVLFKKKLIKPQNKIIAFNRLFFYKLKIKNCLKGEVKNKVFKKGKIIKDLIVIKKQNKRNLLNFKLTKTKNNQVKIIKDYKKNNGVKFCSNVYFLKKKRNKILKFASLIFIGLVIGFVNGFWGGGGGMLCVPTLSGFLRLPEKKAHATAILIMLPLSLASFIVYLFNKTISWDIAGFVTAGFVLGGILGAILLKKINNLVLKILFGLVIIAGAIKLLI